MKLLKRYTFFGILQLFIFKVRTYFVFKNARLIRFPFRVRGKNHIEIGKGFTTGFNCRLDVFNHNNLEGHLLTIGKNVEINDDVHIAAVEKINIGDNVLIASKVYIADHNHGNYKGQFQDSPLSTPHSRKIYTDPILIEKNVWLGEFVCVLQGVTIGEGSIIGAMSVVTKDIPPYSIAVGSPAKVIKTYDFNTHKWVKI
ncbi:acetyltransferase [Flavobacterium qiangtangense]|uniref:Acetyltransferase n=1 Tax=Flavobacterium qiangtangense TaxID=1442595 RepID=A0ABW1PQX5_9FLAO